MVSQLTATILVFVNMILPFALAYLLYKTLKPATFWQKLAYGVIATVAALITFASGSVIISYFIAG